jgi:pimeloyl-ACP methyl ester carboxylesterase
MKKTGLALPGYACTAQIWKEIGSRLAPGIELTPVNWPGSLTPRFERIDDFASWLCDEYPISQYDFIIGHSLGGLVAVKAMAELNRSDQTIILLESFLTPPGPFFQNLLMPKTPLTLEAEVKQMLKDEREFYSARLQNDLKQVNLCNPALFKVEKVYALYGDRGCGDAERVKQELSWPGWMKARIPVGIVGNSSHFPMLENPQETTQALREWILNS